MPSGNAPPLGTFGIHVLLVSAKDVASETDKCPDGLLNCSTDQCPVALFVGRSVGRSVDRELGT